MKIHEAVEAAIKAAKSRAKTAYRTQYVFPIEGGFCVRSQLSQTQEPVAKVTYAGEITRFPEVEEAQ